MISKGGLQILLPKKICYPTLLTTFGMVQGHPKVDLQRWIAKKNIKKICYPPFLITFGMAQYTGLREHLSFPPLFARRRNTIRR